MNIASIKSYNKVFKQSSANAPENKANNLAIDDARADEFISSKNTSGNKKNNTWKWLLGIVAFTALAIGLIFEKKAGNAMKAEKEAIEKAKKEAEERLIKEKEELENKLKEEQKKLDDFLKDNPTNDEKKAIPSNNQTSSNNTNITSGNDSGSNSSNLSKRGENSGKSINTQSTHTENPSGNTSSASQNNSEIETLKDLQEKTRIAEAETQRMKNLELKNKIINGVDEINNTLGLGKVVGYTDIKNILTNKFITPVTKNQKEMIPNMIFMYGPKGTGKTFIANSVAEETQCDIIHLEPSLDTIGDLENLKQVVQKAKIHYQKTNQRSVIIVDEIDSLLNTNNNNINNIASEYKALIDNISNHGATIIGTTNHPQDINKEFYNIKKFEKLYLPPMPKEDMPEMIKHYADIIADSSVNYSELAELICQRAGEGAYSNDRIASIIKHKSKSINNLLEDGATPQMLTHQHLVDAINESTPDISKETIESYKRI